MRIVLGGGSGMPTTIKLTDPQYPRSGITITWTKTVRRLDIWGWYDHYVGIDGTSMTLGQFFKRLNITQKDCEKAFKEGAKND